MKELIPLKQSHAFDTYEDELRRLFITLYQTMLVERASDVNCYAAPHLGSEKLLRQYLVSQDISNFNTEEIHVNHLRYLLETLRYRNPKRGLHFLSAYISLIWGRDFRIEQLVQAKNGIYPLDLHSENEVRNQENYFLTSRLRIVLLGINRSFSESIAKSLNRLLPARLFVDEIIKVVESKSEVFIADSSAFYSVAHGEPIEIVPDIPLSSELVFASNEEIKSISHGHVVEFVPPTILDTELNLNSNIKLLSISSGMTYDKYST